MLVAVPVSACALLVQGFHLADQYQPKADPLLFIADLSRQVSNVKHKDLIPGLILKGTRCDLVAGVRFLAILLMDPFRTQKRCMIP